MNEDVIRQHAAAGVTRAVHPDARRHFEAILEQLGEGYPTALGECPNCGRIGLPERVHEHDC